MIPKVNNHNGNELWYGKMRTVSVAEARFLKRRKSPGERPCTAAPIVGPKLFSSTKKMQVYSKMGSDLKELRLTRATLSSAHAEWGCKQRGTGPHWQAEWELGEWAPQQPLGCTNWLMYKPEHRCIHIQRGHSLPNGPDVHVDWSAHSLLLENLHGKPNYNQEVVCEHEIRTKGGNWMRSVASTGI